MRLSIGFHVDSVEFTPGVIAGTESLGGSESACVGLARALAARGHRVVVFTTQLHPDAAEIDHAGVAWCRTDTLAEMSTFVDWDVFVALRQPQIFGLGIPAGYRILWNQDLLIGDAAKNQIMSTAWAYDTVAYVSEYHRKQWEAVAPDLAPLGWVTRNGYDPALVPMGVTTVPNRIIHISRPERGLGPLLAMWPEVRKRIPGAELQICRYNSMYDAQGWGKVCAAYDAEVARVQAEVGGITYLGELGKPALYRAIAEAAVMWYPGVVDFAETSCIAAIEAQACGTPFVGSYKGALPETAPYAQLIRGDAMSPEYQSQSIEAVCHRLSGDQGHRSDTTKMRSLGYVHVQSYTFDALAAEWEAFLLDRFQRRINTQGPAVLARLLHEDDHVAAQVLARELGDTAAADYCQYIIDGKDQVAEDYAARAVDPRHEIAVSARVKTVVAKLAGATRLLDIACGNGAFAIALAQANPDARVVGVDYAQGNIDVARQCADEMGVGDRVTFFCAPAYDFAAHQATEALASVGRDHGPFDGVFVGEFLEHIAAVTPFLQTVQGMMTPGARVVCTMPSGPFGELAQRDVPLKKGHVHHFRPDDLSALFGAQDDLSVEFMEWGHSPRGSRCGQWVVSYRRSDAPIGDRPIARRLLTTRPKAALSVGILVDQTTDVDRCLSTVWAIADEIILGDTGAPAAALARLVAEYPRTRVVPVGAVHDLEGGFAEARNRVLAAATGDWFCWIDTDERLVRADAIGKYLEGHVFHGYGIRQNHLMLDAPLTFDTPVRIFRRRPDIAFYGCVHEQPQMGDCNGDIVPALQIADGQIAHTGYLTDDIRKDKALQRNLPLLMRDRQVFAERRLGQLLVLRDCLNLAIWSRERAGGAMTPQARQYYGQVIALFEREFMDPSDKYHALARPFYELALQQLPGALEVEVSFAGAVGGMQGRHAKPLRLWVRTQEHLRAVLAARQAEWLKPLEPAPPIDVEPWTPAAAPEVADMEGVPV